MSCLAEYRDSLYNTPKLTYFFIEMTDYCNLNCKHCGSNCEQAVKNHINTSLIIKTLRELAEDFNPQRVMICLTGGEPLLHPDFFVIVQEIVRLKFPWGMTTNGILIDDTVACKLKLNKINSISISLDGLEQSHEWLRNKKGCFNQAIAAIQRLNKVEIPVQVTTVIHKKNFCELNATYDLMCSLNLHSWRVINVEPIGKALDNRDLILSSNEFIQLLDFIKEKRYSIDKAIDVRFGCSHYLSFDYEREVRDYYFICGAGIYVASVLCNGDIYACLDIERREELVQGNIKTDRFSEVWKNRFKEFRVDRTQLCDECKKCKERVFCKADSFHTWDFDKNKPRFCILSKGE